MNTVRNNTSLIFTHIITFSKTHWAYYLLTDIKH